MNLLLMLFPASISRQVTSPYPTQNHLVNGFTTILIALGPVKRSSATWVGSRGPAWRYAGPGFRQ